MFALSPTLDVSWVPRKPRNASQMELGGWRFLSLRRRWDAIEREELLAATGLAAISPSYAEHASQGWWKAFLNAYLTEGEPVRAAEEANARYV